MANARIHMLPNEIVDQEQLLEGLRAGSADAFHALYRLYLPKVAGLCRLLLRDVGVDDAIQDTFLRVFHNIHQFRGDSRLTTWIHRIAVNVCLSELRKRRSRGQTVELAEQDEPTEHTEQTWIDRDAGHALRGLLNRLDPIKRATFHLHHVEDLTAAEIGEVLGEPRATVLKRLQRTRVELLDAWHAAQKTQANRQRGGQR